jgi:hypothetical protein
MELSEAYKVTGPAPVFSPDGSKLAAAVDHRVVLRDAGSLEVEQIVQCQDRIDSVAFAPDSDLTLCAMRVRGAARVVSSSDSSFVCTVSEGSAGLRSARFAPDSRHLLCVTEHSARLSVWSLIHRELSAAISCPKLPESTLCFSSDGRFMALVHRHDCSDIVAVYDTSSWELASCFNVASSDLQQLHWSRSGSLAIADSPIDGRLFVYSPLGEKLMETSSPEDSLGIRYLSFEAGSELLVAGGYDERARVFNTLTWSEVASLEHESKVMSPRHLAIYVEQQAEDVDDNSEYKTHHVPFHISGSDKTSSNSSSSSSKAHDISPLVKAGVTEMKWSFDSRFLATRTESQSHVVRIWDVWRLELCAILVQRSSVRCMAWDTTRPRLALCTATDKVFIWSRAGATCIRILIPGMTISRISWNPHGSAMLLSDKHSYAVGFESDFGDGETDEGTPAMLR